jgi:hypothetical protein
LSIIDDDKAEETFTELMSANFIDLLLKFIDLDEDPQLEYILRVADSRLVLLTSGEALGLETKYAFTLISKTEPDQP